LWCSGRGQFEYEKKEISPPSSAQSSREQKAKESDGQEAGSKAEKGGEKGGEEEGGGGDSPSTDVKDNDRREIFAARQKMSEFGWQDVENVLLQFTCVMNYVSA